MPTLSANKFYITKDTLVRGTYALDSGDSLRLALCAPGAPTPPTASNTTWTTGTGTGSATELSSGSGYTQGGVTLATTALTADAGSGTVAKCANPASPTWTASGTRDIRYFVLWNFTIGSGISGSLLAWWDYGTTLSLSTNDTLDCNASNFASTGWASLD